MRRSPPTLLSTAASVPRDGERDRSSRATHPLQAALVAAAIVAGTAYREPFAFARPQLWAEDGPILLLQAYVDGWGALLQPYAGYHLLYQRIVAALSIQLPIAWVPAAFIAGNVLAQISVALLCLSRRMPAPRWVRIAMALAVTFSPAQNEVFNKLVNSQWVLALAPLLVLAYEPPRSVRQRALDLFVLALAGLSGPFGLIYLPLFGAKALLARADRHAWALLGVDAVCAFVQSRGLVYTKAPGALSWSLDHLRAVNGMFGHLVAGSWARPAPAGAPLNWAIACAVLAGVAAIAYQALSRRRWPSMVFLAGGMSVLAATMYAFRNIPAPLVAYGDRYWYVPSVGLVWAVLALLDGPRPSLRQPILLVTLLLFVFAFLQDARSSGAASIDRNWPEASRCIGKQHPCSITVNPGWTFTLP